jgi:hypothetical protein
LLKIKKKKKNKKREAGFTILYETKQKKMHNNDVNTTHTSHEKELCMKSFFSAYKKQLAAAKTRK